MYSRLVNAAVINQGTDFFSQSISMKGANAVEIDAMTFYAKEAAGTLSVDLQGSNDLENWVALVTGCHVVGVAYDANNYGDAGTERIGFAYLRIKASLDTSGNVATFTAGLRPYSA